jgi:hypothetical protein
MRDIYTPCERCIAWLREEDENTKDAISFLKFFAQDKHLHEWDGFSANNWLFATLKWIKEILPSQSSPIEDQILNVLLNYCFITKEFDTMPEELRRRTTRFPGIGWNGLQMMSHF